MQASLSSVAPYLFKASEQQVAEPRGQCQVPASAVAIPPATTQAGSRAVPPRFKKRPSARGTAFYPRKRVATACQVCRARKTKCDNKLPSCSYCLSVGANCVQDSNDPRSFDAASLRILNRLDDLECLLRKNPNVPPPSNVITQHGSFDSCDSGHAQSVHPNLETLSSPTTEATNWGRGSIGSAVSKTTTELIEYGLSNCGVVPQRIEKILQWPLLAPGGGGHRQLPPTKTPQIVVDCLPMPGSTLFNILESEPGHVQHLVDGFFRYVHCSNPILHEAWARRIVKETVMVGIDWSPASCLTLLICALGCLGSSFEVKGGLKPSTKAYADSKVLFEAAQKRIGSLPMNDDLLSAQCHFLSGIYMMCVFQPTYAWRYFLQTLATCQSFPSITWTRQMGSCLGRPVSSEASARDPEEEAVYWSAWKSERELRKELSLPDFDMQYFGNTLYPPFFPTPPSPTEETTMRSGADAQRGREAWLFYLADISLRRLNSRVWSEILELWHKSVSSSAFLDAMLAMIPECEAQAYQWRDNLPEELTLTNPIENDGISQWVLRGKLINFFEAIYWPFVGGSLDLLAANVPVPTPVRDMVTRGLSTHVTQISLNERGFEHRHHGCYFMIRSCTRSALVLLAAAKAGAQMPTDWGTFVRKVASMLTFWEEEDHELAPWRAFIEASLRELAH